MMSRTITINFLNGNLILRKHKTGVHLVHENLVRQTVRKKKYEVCISVYESLKSLYQRYGDNIPYKKYLDCGKKCYRVLLYILPVDLLFKTADIYVCDGLVPYSLRGSKKIAIIHDMMVYLYPDNYSLIRKWYLKLYFYSVKKRSDMILAVSNTTKKDIMKYLSIDEKKIKVMYIAGDMDDISKNVEIQNVNGYDLSNQYLFYIGDCRPNKNLITAIRGYERALEKIPELYFYIAGNSQSIYGKELKEYVYEKKLEKVIFLGYVTDEEKIALYQKCFAFVFVSDYEGFGIPVLEAMNSRVPVITSDCSSMKEIAKGAGILVNPHDAEDIGNAICSLVNPIYRKEIIELETKRAKDFSWSKMGNQFELIIDNLMKGK